MTGLWDSLGVAVVLILFLYRLGHGRRRSRDNVVTPRWRYDHADDTKGESTKVGR